MDDIGDGVQLEMSSRRTEIGDGDGDEVTKMMTKGWKATAPRILIARRHDHGVGGGE